LPLASTHLDRCAGEVVEDDDERVEAHGQPLRDVTVATPLTTLRWCWTVRNHRTTYSGVVALDPPRPVAPIPAAVVRDFVNTDDHETGEDALSTTSGLGRYLRAEGLWDGVGTVRRAHLDSALLLRSALRGALEHHHDGLSRPPDELRRAFGDVPVALDYAVDRGPVPTAGGTGAAQALARVAVAAHECAALGIWDRLKVCSADDCAWAYYDHSKNRSRNWCEYGCGNKVKTRAYRARQRA
jgi:predicted RNA-binding Zn ribbon-like protein